MCFQCAPPRAQYHPTSSSARHLGANGCATQESIIPEANTSTALVRFRIADTLEILRRRRELAGLRQQLIAREQLLGEQRAQLISFEGRYLRQVGLLYRRLDDWERKIAELHGKANELEEDDGAAWVEDDLTPQFDPQILKATYRDLVKLLHPDFAADAKDEQRRTRLMALANEAYARQDIAAIRRMLTGYDPTLDLASAKNAHDEAVRLSTIIFQVTQDLEAVNLQIEELRKSDSAALQERALEAARQGRDLLAEMAARVNGSIGIAMRRYELDLSRQQRPSRGMRVEDLLTAERSGDKA